MISNNRSVHVWQQAAKQLIKIELLKSNKNYAWLAEQLGMERASLVNKINRGTFSAAFFLEALAILGATQIYLPKSSDGK